jgi:HEAT repeat protein
MGLKKRVEDETEAKERRYRDRDKDGLLEQLLEPDPVARRWAAHDLADYAEAMPALLERLSVETDRAVQSALLSSLVHAPSLQAARGLMRLLRSEDAGLRNAVIEALTLLPREVAEVVEELLRDHDSDVRILTANLLVALPHPGVPNWLYRLAIEDDHPNVVAGALEGLSECGTQDMVPELTRLKTRFREAPFVTFAADFTIGRIEKRT